MFERVLIANRGEIAVRVIRTLRRMGVASVAVYSDADRHAPHVALADEAVPLGDARAYLDAGRLVAAARAAGADAVHPGYGFLSENAAFARVCAEAGIVFIGPPAAAMEAMGDKINAKRTVASSGVPVVPGRDEAGLDDEQLVTAALAVGLPVLLKPSAGGGGKGMRLVTSEADLPREIAAARREATGAFGDGTLLVERYVLRPRHIEMQVFADTHGNCVALGERECTLQRRHQKIVEEAPSPLLDAATRVAMADSAVAAARACGYVGAGTVEFIVSADRPDEYFFMEMNTRLQVEHPVTEMVLGVDLVEVQLRVAAGEALPWRSQSDVPEPSGHAVEARIYAEDPDRGFLPSSGPVLLLREPASEASGGPVRVDSGLCEGNPVGTTYDPMLSKVVAWGPDRASALRDLDRALGETTVLGVTTNVAFLRRLLRDPAVQRGELDTDLVGRVAPSLAAGPTPDHVLVAAALLASVSDSAPAGPWEVRDGWRVGGLAPQTTEWLTGGESVSVTRLSAAGCATVTTRGERSFSACRAEPAGPHRVAVEVDGRRRVYDWARDGDDLWLGREGEAWRLTRRCRALLHRSRTATGAAEVTSPMPGTVLDVLVQAGESVEAGQRLVVVEAMKMEHTVSAPAPGTVSEVLVQAGQAVKLEQILVVMEQSESEVES